MWCISAADNSMQTIFSFCFLCFFFCFVFWNKFKILKVLRCPCSWVYILSDCSVAHLYYFKMLQPSNTGGGCCSAVEDEWVQCYHLTNQNVFEGSSIALSDLLLINAVPLWDSVEAEMVKETRTHTHTCRFLQCHFGKGSRGYTHLKCSPMSLCIFIFPSAHNLTEHNAFSDSWWPSIKGQF